MGALIPGIGKCDRDRQSADLDDGNVAKRQHTDGKRSVPVFQEIHTGAGCVQNVQRDTFSCVQAFQATVLMA